LAQNESEDNAFRGLREDMKVGYGGTLDQLEAYISSQV